MDYIHIQHASSCLSIMFLYLDEFWTKQFFTSKIQVLKNTEFGFRQNFKTQKEFKIFVTWFDFYSNKFVFQREYKNLFLWIFRVFMGFNWKAPVDRVGRPAESSVLCSRPRSTGPVDRWLNGQKSDRWSVDRQPSGLKICPNG